MPRRSASAARGAHSLSGVIPRKYRGVSFDRPPVTEIARARVAVVRALRQPHRRAASTPAAACGSSARSAPARRRSRCSSPSHALEAGRSVAIYSLPRLLAEIRTTFDDDRGNSYVDLLDRLTAVDLLHIDDVGAEKTSPWVLEQLYAIVNARYEDERSIIITTNLERDELAEQINERTVSRLEEMCEVLPLYGADAAPAVAPDAAHDGAAAAARPAPPRLYAVCLESASSAPSGATKARGRSSTCSPSGPTRSCAFRAATTPATRSSATARSSSSTSSRRGILYPGKRCIIGNGVVVDPRVLTDELDALQGPQASTRAACASAPTRT